MEAKDIFERMDNKIEQFEKFWGSFLHPHVILLGEFEVKELKNLSSKLPGKAVIADSSQALDGFIGMYRGLDIWEVKAEFRLEVY